MMWIIMLQLFGVILFVATSALGCEVKQIENVIAKEVRSSVIRLSWNAPSATDLQCVKGYRVCSTPEAQTAVCKDVMDSSINEYSITGLDSCTEYSVSVAAIGDNNVTSMATSITATTAPRPVSGLGVSRRDNDSITAMWSYHQTVGRSCAALFQLTLCDVREIMCNTYNVTLNGGYYSKQLFKKRDCNSYFINLVVLDSNHHRSENFRFDGEPDGTAVPEKLKVTYTNSSSLALEWEIPASQVNCDYTVLVNINYIVGITSYGFSTLYDGGRTNHTQAEISPCTACVVAVNFGSSRSLYNATTMAYTLPADKIFDNATVTEVTGTSVSVWWNTTLDVDQCVDVYSVCWEKLDTSAVDCRNTTSDKTSYQVTGLQSSTKYQLSVAALLHTGVQYDTVTLEASTKSGAAGVFHNYVVGILAITICLLSPSI